MKAERCPKPFVENGDHAWVSIPASGSLASRPLLVCCHCREMRDGFDHRVIKPGEQPDAAPEMPRPPAEEADAEYMVVIPSLCGNPTDYRMSYSSDRVRKSTREAAIAHGLEVEGHDDWLIAIVVGDKLTGLAWQHEDRDDAEEVEEAAAALGLTAAFAMPIPAAQEPASGPETAGTGSGRGTGVTEAQKASRAIELDPTEGKAIEIEHPLLGDTIETEYLGETNGIHRWRLTNPATGANSITFPSLPVPSTEASDEH